MLTPSTVATATPRAVLHVCVWLPAAPRLEPPPVVPSAGSLVRRVEGRGGERRPGENEREDKDKDMIGI